MDPLLASRVWQRLVGVAAEISTDIRRTAFSSTVRETGDYACGILSRDRHLLAQAPFTNAIYANGMSAAADHCLEYWPATALRDGDALITNDPWYVAGHLPDMAVILPVFYRGDLISYIVSFAHLSDIGGRVWGANATSIHEEGLLIPPMRYYCAGHREEGLVRLLTSNVRLPGEVIGDIESLVGANQKGARRLCDALDEYGLTGLDEVAAEIVGRSSSAMNRAIDGLARGEFRSEMYVDGLDGPARLAVRVAVSEGDLVVDFTGSAEQNRFGLNSVFIYTRGWVLFALKCMLAPDIPNNAGIFDPVTVVAPPGSFVNALVPAALGAKGRVGHFIPTCIFAALADAAPGRVIAGSGSNGLIYLNGANRQGHPFAVLYPVTGGMGASAQGDGLSVTYFPSTMTALSAEAFEMATGFRIEEKILRPESGGRGAHRGGAGQRLVIAPTSAEVAARTTVSLNCSGVEFPPCGIRGGGPGSVLHVSVEGRGTIHPHDQLTLTAHERLITETSGGGGYGEDGVVAEGGPRGEGALRHEAGGTVSEDHAPAGAGQGVAGGAL